MVAASHKVKREQQSRRLRNYGWEEERTLRRVVSLTDVTDSVLIFHCKDAGRTFDLPLYL